MQKLEFDKKARREIKFCPCGRSNKDGKFCPYKGFENKGFCHSCGETFLPKTENVEAWRKSDEYKKPLARVTEIEPSFIAPIIARQTMKHYNTNNFIQFLTATFKNDETVIKDLINRFSIGTAKHGYTIFWQVDINGNVRSGQCIFYNPTTGKRDQDINISWAHKLLQLLNFNLKQCFFGEWQLSTENKTVAIVEAAKTAAIMTPIEPRYTWLGAGGANGLTVEKCKVLHGFKIVLYPDLGKFEQWKQQAKELKATLNLDITVSELLENYVSKLPTDKAASDIKAGYDIADYYLQYDFYNEIKLEQQPKTLPPSKAEQVLQSMIQKQPLLKNLIHTLSMVNSKTMQPFQSI